MSNTIKEVLERYMGGSDCFTVHPETDVYHPNGHVNKEVDQALAEIKRIIEECEPGVWTDQEGTEDLEWKGYVQGVTDYHQNLLKELEG